MTHSNYNETIEQFKKFYAIYDEVVPYITMESIQTYITQNRLWIERLEQAEFPVAFLGTFSAGKSTTVNAILERDLLPESTKATTAFPTVIRKGDKDDVIVYYLSDEGKYELQGILIKSLSKEIEEDLGVDDRTKFLENVNRKISEFEEQRKTKINREA